MISDSAQQFESLCREVARRRDRDFAASLFVFLSHLQNDTWCRAAADDLRREELASIATFTEEARQIAVAIGSEYTAVKEMRLRSVASSKEGGRVESMSSLGKKDRANH